MAYRRRSTSRNRGTRKRVSTKSYAPRKGYSRRKPVYASKRKRVRGGNSRRSGRGVLQTLRIELAPGLSIGQGAGGLMAKPLKPRRTRHF